MSSQPFLASSGFSKGIEASKCLICNTLIKKHRRGERKLYKEVTNDHLRNTSDLPERYMFILFTESEVLSSLS